MTIYFDHLFEDGTSQQIGTVEKLVVPFENIDFMMSSPASGGMLSGESVVTATPGKSGRISLFGYKDRAGREPQPLTLQHNQTGKLVIPELRGPQPALTEGRWATVISAMAYMLGGAVSISGEELVRASTDSLVVSQYIDPYVLRINVHDKEGR
jgi:hypothetical protein